MFDVFVNSSCGVSPHAVKGTSRSIFLFLFITLLTSPPAQAIIDTNQNGVSDVYERHYNNGDLYLTFDPLADPDGDGWTNEQEAATGTDPTDANPPVGFVRPEITQSPAVYLNGEEEGDPPILLTPATTTIEWPTLAGKQYTVFASADLSPGSWIQVGEPRSGSTSVLGTNIPLTQPDGSIPQSLFLRVSVTDTDSDQDRLTDAEENQIGSSVYLVDTNGDGTDDYTSYAAGIHPAGKDVDGDGVSDDALYSVEFEVTEETLSTGTMGHEALTGTDNLHRYLTLKTSEEYSITDSPEYSDIVDGKYTAIDSYLKNGIPQGYLSIHYEGITPYDAYEAHKLPPLASNEILEFDPRIDTIIGPTIGATEIFTTTTRSTPWRVKKNVPGGSSTTLRSGTQVTVDTYRRKLSDKTTSQELWTNHFKHIPLTQYYGGPSILHGPRSASYAMLRAGLGDVVTAGMIRNNFRNEEFYVSGSISVPAFLTRTYTPQHINREVFDVKLKSLRWRWVRFNPLSPFEYDYATSPASYKTSFRFLVQQTNTTYNHTSPTAATHETISKGIIEIDCKGSDGGGWHTVNPDKYAPYKVEEPAGFANLDFTKGGITQVSFGNPPIHFITGAGTDIHALNPVAETSDPPSVRLDTIATDDVVMSGSEATVTIAGDVYDAIMGTAPAGGGADIQGVKVFINGAKTDFEGALVRNTEHQSFWSPEGPKASIQAFNVTMPASGVNRVTVETTENAAGLKGRAEFDVVFEKTFTASPGSPAQTIAHDLLLPASFSASVNETVHLVLPGQQTGDPLVETSNDSHVFRSAQSGITLLIDQAFQPTALLDNLPCVLSIPGMPVDNGALGTAISCQETAGNSLRFTYNRTAPASAPSSTYTWTLSSVDMGSEGYIGMAHPIAFQAPYLGDDAVLDWLDTEFSITRQEDGGQYYASTAEGKPLIGFLIRKEDEDGIPTREFIYYDHEAGAIQRKEMPAAAIKTTYKLKLGTTNLADLETPVVGWRLLDHEGNPSTGILPVSIESLIDLAEGDTTVTIPEESQGIAEIIGRKAGDVLRMFSPEETADRFDLTVPGEVPITPPASRNAELIEIEDGVHRTQEKLVIYSSGGDEGPLTLTDSQWQALKTAGYLAVHNAAPVIASTKDLEWAMKKFGPANLPLPGTGDAIPMGVSGVTDPRKAEFHRFAGYQDHHVFNQYDNNLPKRNRWTKIFGNDFDVDEFTVPVKQGYHLKVGHQITNEWETFLNQSFDDTHQLKPGVDVQHLRRQTLDKMREIHGRWGIDASRLRPYPAILKDSLTTRPTLCNRLVSNKGRLGCSMDKFKVIDEMAFGPLFKGTNSARNSWWKVTAKKIFKREGRNGIGKVIPILSSAITVASIATASANVTQVGWEEAVAQEINNQLALDDIELAREAVRQQFKTGLIGGGTPRPVLPLANGQVIGMNERTYRCSWGNSGTINSATPYVISEIKVFPDGTTKIAAVMEEPPFDSIIEENPDFIIRDYWPKIDDSSQLYMQARARAMANTSGNP